ncbi:MAG: hypothetical protein RJA36_2997 [Pseudomonadota bacterium]|jgi:AmmeMemoRadiSam system protein A
MHAESGTVLLALARSAIERALALPATGCVESGQHDWLRQPGASFVTLTQRGQLRGCIGSLEARRPLANDVQHNAVAAALHDPRFVPLAAAELRFTMVEVSVLSPAEPLEFDDETDALARLRPGLDGIVLEYGARRSTFLPQVWEQLPEPRDFLSQLKRKAGLGSDFWHPSISLQRYSVAKFKESA